MKSKFAIPLSLLVVFIISACELPRPDDDAGNISPDIPVVAGPETPDRSNTPVPLVTPPDSAEIEADGVAPPIAPDAQAVVPGQVLVKLAEQAAIQALDAEQDNAGIMAAGIPSLDQLLQQIGANELEPVIEEVAGVLNKDIEAFSIEATNVSQLFSVNYSASQSPA